MGSIARDRDLFPLPMPYDVSRVFVGSEPFSALSGKVQRRLLRGRHANQWVNDVVTALNQLSGAPFSSAPVAPRSAAQSAALALILGDFGNVPGPDPDLVPARAFRELCGTSSRYDPTTEAVGDACAYNED